MLLDALNFGGAQAAEEGEDPESDLVGRPGFAQNVSRLAGRKRKRMAGHRTAKRGGDGIGQGIAPLHRPGEKGMQSARPATDDAGFAVLEVGAQAWGGHVDGPVGAETGQPGGEVTGRAEERGPVLFLRIFRGAVAERGGAAGRGLLSGEGAERRRDRGQAAQAGKPERLLGVAPLIVVEQNVTESGRRPGGRGRGRPSVLAAPVGEFRQGGLDALVRVGGGFERREEAAEGDLDAPLEEKGGSRHHTLSGVREKYCRASRRDTRRR